MKFLFLATAVRIATGSSHNKWNIHLISDDDLKVADEELLNWTNSSFGWIFSWPPFANLTLPWCTTYLCTRCKLRRICISWCSVGIGCSVERILIYFRPFKLLVHFVWLHKCVHLISRGTTIIKPALENFHTI